VKKQAEFSVRTGRFSAVFGLFLHLMENFRADFAGSIAFL